MGDRKGISGYYSVGTYSEGFQDFSNRTDLRKHDPECECIRKYAAVQVLCLPIAEATDERHMIFINRIEDEYYVRIDHSMTKEHYISFVAALSSDGIQMVKLYPEGACEARFKIRGVKKILFYCNRDGLYSIDVIKGIDDKESGYDDSKERRELEKAARVLFG